MIAGSLHGPHGRLEGVHPGHEPDRPGADDLEPEGGPRLRRREDLADQHGALPLPGCSQLVSQVRSEIIGVRDVYGTFDSNQISS